MYIHEISGVTPMYGTRRYCEKDVNIDFDLVTCNQVLEHVPEPLKILEEISAVMSPKTWLYFDLPFEKIMQGNANLEARLKQKKTLARTHKFFLR